MNKAESASLSIATTTPMLFQDLFRAFRRMYAEIKVTHTYLNLHQLTDVELLKQFDFLIAAPSDLSTNAMDSTVLYRNDRPVLMVYPEPVSYTHLDVYKRQPYTVPPLPGRPCSMKLAV